MNTAEHKVDRAELQARIASHLEQLDEDTLQWVYEVTRQAVAGVVTVPEEDEPRLLTRRQLLAGLVAGGMVLSGSNLATAWYAHSQGEAAGQAMGSQVARAVTAREVAQLQHRMAVEMAQLRVELQTEAERLRGLLALYEELERVPLEDAIRAGIAGFARAIGALDEIAKALAAGLESAQAGLERFETALPTLGEATARVEEALAAVERRLERLREVLGDSAERASSLAEAAGQFLDRLLGRLPQRIAGPIREVVAQFLDLVELVPQALETVRDKLLHPVRQLGIGETGETAIQTWLTRPLRAGVLDPAHGLVQAIEELAATWHSSLVEPVQQSLERRQAIRREIEAYRQRYDLS
jgi:hypothetical protein